MPSKKLKLGTSVIMFVSDTPCGACTSQQNLIKQLHEEFNKVSMYKKFVVTSNNVPSFIVNCDGSYVTPTWYIPTKGGYGTIKKGALCEATLKKIFKLVKQRCSNFGQTTTPEINTLTKYGKTFPNGNNFQIPNSFLNTMEAKWGVGNATNSGTLGRELPPGNFDKVYNNDYFYQPRMGGPPGGPYDAALFLNRECNILRPGTSNESYGMLNSPNKQLVSSFGRKKNNFGNLYNQMGPAYGNNFIPTGYSGGVQSGERPSKVGGNTFIGRAKPYTR